MKTGVMDLYVSIRDGLMFYFRHDFKGGGSIMQIYFLELSSAL